MFPMILCVFMVKNVLHKVLKTLQFVVFKYKITCKMDKTMQKFSLVGFDLTKARSEVHRLNH